jgi:hypothetical protein
MTYVGVNRSRKRKPTSCICGCGATLIHAKGLAKRCYKKLRSAYVPVAKRLTAKQLTYNVPGEPPRLIPTVAKGWGCL